MTKKKDTYEFLKPRHFAKIYPRRADVLSEDVLSYYVSWVLIDRSQSQVGSTYLLMSTSSYRKACEFYKYREQSEYDDLKKEIIELGVNLSRFQDRETEIEKQERLLKSEIEAVRIIKQNLQRVLEHAAIGNTEVNTTLRGMFEALEDIANRSYVREVGRYKGNYHPKTRKKSRPTRSAGDTPVEE